MNETRREIEEAIIKSHNKEYFFLTAISFDTMNEILKNAEEERKEYKDNSINDLFENFSLAVEEETEDNISFSDFIEKLAYKIKNMGTELWVKNLKKESVEMIVNGIHHAGHCTIILDNNDIFSNEYRLLEKWEELHPREKIKKIGNWDLY